MRRASINRQRRMLRRERARWLRERYQSWLKSGCEKYEKEQDNAH